MDESEVPAAEDYGSEDHAAALQSALAVEELVESNNESNRTMLALVRQVQADTEQRARKVDLLEEQQARAGKLLIVSTAALFFLLVLAVFNAVSITQASANARRTAIIAKDAEQTNNTLLDCLNATGECGKINAKNQVKVLDEVKKYELTGFYCARTNPVAVDPSGEKFIECMKRLYPSGPILNGR